MPIAGRLSARRRDQSALDLGFQPARPSISRAIASASAAPSSAEIWIASPRDWPAGQVDARFRALLDEAERAKADRFAFDDDRQTFLVAHGLLRLALAQCLDCDPTSIAFRADKFGRPELRGAAENDVSFNISHSKHLALVGIARSGRIGVDIESVASRDDLASLACELYTDCELRWMMRGKTRDEITERFFRIWTLKEAYLKMLGTGLSRSTRAFSVVEADGSAVRPAILARFDQSYAPWCDLTSWIPAAGYVAAIALTRTHGRSRDIRFQSQIPN